MREILFRGKDQSGIMNHDWFYGSLDLSFNPEFPIIICKDRFNNIIKVNVDSETIGQYIGLKDKNGTKIFEGDIVKCCGYFDNPQLVKWNNEWCAFEPIFDARPIEAFPILGETNRIEVVGNIHDNPELLTPDEM